MLNLDEIGNEPLDHLHRPYVWMGGEDCDAHVVEFERTRRTVLVAQIHNRGVEMQLQQMLAGAMQYESGLQNYTATSQVKYVPLFQNAQQAKAFYNQDLQRSKATWQGLLQAGAGMFRQTLR